MLKGLLQLRRQGNTVLIQLHQSVFELHGQREAAQVQLLQGLLQFRWRGHALLVQLHQGVFELRGRQGGSDGLIRAQRWQGIAQ